MDNKSNYDDVVKKNRYTKIFYDAIFFDGVQSHKQVRQ